MFDSLKLFLVNFIYSNVSTLNSWSIQSDLVLLFRRMIQLVPILLTNSRKMTRHCILKTYNDDVCSIISEAFQASVPFIVGNFFTIAEARTAVTVFPFKIYALSWDEKYSNILAWLCRVIETRYQFFDVMNMNIVEEYRQKLMNLLAKNERKSFGFNLKFFILCYRTIIAKKK